MKTINLLLISLSIFLVACSNEGNSVSNSEEYAASQNEPDIDFGRPSGNIVTVSDSNNQTVASIYLTSSPSIQVDGQKITSKVGSSGKRKYLDKNGAVLAKINNDRNGKIKLKSEKGSLIWKIKAKPGSIKVANNEEMTSAYKIKTKDASRFKLLVDENEIGVAELVDDVVTVTVADVSMTASGTDYSAAGILGFADVPMVHRLIMFTELSLSSEVQ